MVSQLYVVCCCVCQLYVVGCCSVVAAEVPPPLPVKQRSKSVMTQRGSISRLYSHDNADNDNNDDRPSTTASYRNAASPITTVSHNRPSTAVSQQRHTVSPSSAELTSSLDNLLTELGHDLPRPNKPPLNVRSELTPDLLPPKKPPLVVSSELSRDLSMDAETPAVQSDLPPSKPPLKVHPELSHELPPHNNRPLNVRSELSQDLLPPKKPPLNVRISSYDNFTGRSEDNVDGVKCHIGPSLHHTETRPLGPTLMTSTTSGSDGSASNCTMWISDGPSQRFTSSVSQTPHGVMSHLVASPSSTSSTIIATAGASPLLISPSSISSTAGAAPPLPIKLKHSKSSSCVYC